jgi:hypothetical protein
VYTCLEDYLLEFEVTALGYKVAIDSESQSLGAVLLLGVIAVGRHVLETRSRKPHGPGVYSQLFEAACASMTGFMLDTSSLTKLQVCPISDCR